MFRRAGTRHSTSVTAEMLVRMDDDDAVDYSDCNDSSERIFDGSCTNGKGSGSGFTENTDHGDHKRIRRRHR